MCIWLIVLSGALSGHVTIEKQSCQAPGSHIAAWIRFKLGLAVAPAGTACIGRYELQAECGYRRCLKENGTALQQGQGQTGQSVGLQAGSVHVTAI